MREEGVNKSLIFVRWFLSLWRTLFICFCGDGKTAMCCSRVTCTASISLPLFSFYFEILIYIWYPRVVCARTNKVGKVELMTYIDIDGIPTSGINSLGNRMNSSKKKKREKSNIITHFSLILSSFILLILKGWFFYLRFTSPLFMLFFNPYTFP